MRIISRIIELACPLKPGFSIVISNPPWCDLVITDTQQRGPHGLTSISVAHRGDRDGQVTDLPAMAFEAEGRKNGFILTPYRLRDEFSAVEQDSVYLKEGRITVNWRLQTQHMTFARTWNASLEQQGFLAAYERSAFLAQVRQAFTAELSQSNEWPAEILTGILDRAVQAALKQGLPTINRM